tara:strand:- start:690 stop:857 length:168 start_codon:yes stop_codon:yes gene_type:complete
MIIDLDKAIKSLNANAMFRYNNDDVDTIVWIETTPISKEDILAEQTRLQAIEDAK